MKYVRLFIFMMLFWVPNISSASLIINEIAWQGYLGDANNEWIELHNQGTETLNLDGWLLQSVDGSPSINLSGISINAGDFILLERTDDTTVPEVIATKIYSGALSNEGENLVIKNSSGSVVDSADFSSGWGDMVSTSIGTLSRFGNSWKEGDPTPKSVNISREQEEDTGDDESDAGEGDTDEVQEPDKDSPTGSSRKKKSVPQEPKASIISSSYGFVGVPIEVTSRLTDSNGDEIKRGSYVWNMGDGTVIYRVRRESVTYTYQYPGEYIISLMYSEGGYGQEPEELKPFLHAQHSIVISDKNISFEKVYPDGTVVLKNNSPHTVPLGNWKLANHETQFIIPMETFVRPGKTITFPAFNTKLYTSPVILYNPSGVLVVSTEDLVEDNNFKTLQSKEDDSNNNTQDNQDVSETTSVLSLDNNFNTELGAQVVSASQQKTLYVGIFVLLIILVGIIMWFLLFYKKLPEDTVKDYEVIEE